MKRWTPTGLFVALIFLTSCQDVAVTDPVPVEAPVEAAVGILGQGAENVVAGQYIVVFEPSVSDVLDRVQELLQLYGGEGRFTYQHALKGFSARLPEGVAELIARHPAVRYVEADRTGGIVLTQNGATWGIDRADQRDLPLSSTYTYANDGTGVNAYILDTGVRLSHVDFEGRASYVPNGANGDFVGDGHGSAADCHGHGSHVAGTVGGEEWGVAKGATLWAARVVNCSGSGDVSMAIAAVDWVTANGQRPAVVNMSLGYGNVQALRDAVENSVAAGVNYAVAAGNGHWLFGFPLDACSESPAGAPNALTVGATTSSDGEASFSNYGTCVDILAPGVSVTSAWYNSDTATNTISGTSMATPHVAGAAALYLSANAGATPAQVSNALKTNASLNKIALHSSSQSGGTPNALLYTAFIGGGEPPPPNQAPTAGFTESCTDLDCAFTDTSSDSDGSVVSWSWDFGDGGTSTAQNPSHSYGAAGTYTVSLTVTDDDGATDATSHAVSVTEPPPPPPNQAPTAGFTESCTDLDCGFTDTSSDSDGSLVSWSWDFGDGGTSTAQNPSHSYGAAGTYTVSLTVTDDDGATDATSHAVSVTEPPPPPPNQAPTAGFTESCTDLDCGFTDTSSDSDGSLVSWSWDFGDGGTSTAQNPSHSYGAAGTYTVSLTVTDDDGATDATSHAVSVTEPPPPPPVVINLSVSKRSVWRFRFADLSWSGATSTNVDVYRNGALLASTANDGAYSDNLGWNFRGTVTYRVCEAGTSTCSNDATVSW